ncbi:MAG: glycosyl hydrolase [Gemmatimonadetes bacterium]|nr:glycosyl hydrolase [Gemmatimonadota bacterium]
MKKLPELLALSLLLASRASAQSSWTSQTIAYGGELRGLSVVNDRVAWASGTRGTVIHTVDGGVTWRVDTIPGASALDFRDVEAISASVAVAMSSGEAEKGLARMYRTEDAGRSWTLAYQTDLRGAFLDAISFWDAKRGVVFGDPVDGKFFVLLTSDGGRSWTRVDDARLPVPLTGEAAFAASGSCLAVMAGGHAWIGTGGGAQSRVLQTHDYGRHWSIVAAPVPAGSASAGLFSIAFRDTKHGVAVGGDYTKPAYASDNVAITRDGGRSWRVAKGALPGGYLSGVSFARDARTLVGVGLAGTFVSRDGGDSWSAADSVGYNSVSFAAHAGYAVGPRGRVARWIPSQPFGHPKR